MTHDLPTLHALDPLIGEWRMQPKFPNVPASLDGDARVRFEWFSGERFVIERWEVPVPEAPDGIAIIGADPKHAGHFLQHYFDSRGIARVYRMTLANGVWKLWREEADFSALDFRQRYTGTFSSDGKTITGAWEICHDGRTWEHDFELNYTRVS
jgi:hypothetical protein